MQTALSRIWTRVSDSISYNDNCYTKHASSVKVNFWKFSTEFSHSAEMDFLLLIIKQND